MISETHFTEKNHFKLQNYTLYDTKHPDGKAHGGTAILIKRNIKHHEECAFQCEDIQATTITIEDCQGPLRVSSIYCNGISYLPCLFPKIGLPMQRILYLLTYF